MRSALRELRILARDPLLLFLVGTVFVLVGLFVVFPLAEVAVASLQTRGAWTLEHYELLARRRLYRNALVNSLSVAALVGVIGTALGFVLAFVLTRVRVPFKRALHLIILLPIISPPFVGAVSARQT